MNFGSLTCHCRYCGNLISYSRADIGTDAHCPNCAQVIRLPGKLEKVATIERLRLPDRPGIALEITGFAAMFFFFPWGLMMGLVMVIVGWRRCNRLVCSSCTARLSNSGVESCPRCRAKFTRE